MDPLRKRPCRAPPTQHLHTSHRARRRVQVAELKRIEAERLKEEQAILKAQQEQLKAQIGRMSDEELDLATDEIALKLDPEQVAVPRGGLPPRARCLGWTSSACSLRMPLRGNDPLLT